MDLDVIDSCSCVSFPGWEFSSGNASALQFLMHFLNSLIHIECMYVKISGITGMESSKETGCQVPEGPILCINNCGFFGSAATMNMCSKCHKDMVFQQQQVSLATSSIENIVKASSSSVNEKEPVLVDMVKTEAGAVEVKEFFSQSSSGLMSGKSSDTKAVEGPKRCTSCHKRVGLTGFNCKCGHLFCSVHRYSDKHDCQFDYRSAAQDAIAKANPLVKGEKLEKI